MKTEYNDDDLRKEAPKLFGMERKNPFEVPDGFFDSFSSNVQDKIVTEKKQTVWSVVFETVIKPRIAIPVLASLCLVAVGIKIMYRPSTVINYNETAITYNDLSQSDYLTDIDESILTDALNTATGAVNSNSKTGSDSYRIENYLIENNIDVSDLVSELN